MSSLILGGLAGAGSAGGIVLTLSALRRRRPTLIDRVQPYVQERRRTSALLSDPYTRGNPHDGGLGELLHQAICATGVFLENLGSSAESVRHRLQRCGSETSYEDFRIQQLVWAGIALAVTLGLGLVTSLARPVNLPALFIVAIIAAIGSASVRDWVLTRAVQARRRRTEAQLPDVVELLALAVTAGEGPVGAIERVVRLAGGDFIDELSRTLADVRSGTVLSTALDRMASRSSSTMVTRFCEAMSVALDRGTPLADVLRAQASDAREASRRRLMEEGGKREIAQMVPVVFIILPVTVIFVLFPGYVVLRLGL